MQIRNARWTDATRSFVKADVDGGPVVFPASPDNRHYADLLEGGGPIGEPSLPAIGEAELLAHAAELRWRREVGGLVVAGVPVATDDRSKTMIIGARLAAQVDPAWTTVWHGADGQAYPLDASAIITVSDAVQAHVNAGFVRFAAVRSAILAGELTTLEAVAEAMATQVT